MRTSVNLRVQTMKHQYLNSLSVDKLWALHEQVNLELSRKIAAEKARLDQRLRQLGVNKPFGTGKMGHTRRPYPQVFPKYRNPAQPGETWAGRGKQPRWLTAQLESGKKLDDFRIKPSVDWAKHSPTVTKIR
jgi:DNA-binding protein H-NS